MLAVQPILRAAVLAGGACMLMLTVASPARADCQTDIQGYMKRRDGVIAQLKNMTQGKKKQLDPIAACPKFRALSGILGETVAYMEKNKDWCAIPDQMVDGAKQQRGQFASTASKACSIAAKVQQMKAQAEKQAAQGGGMGGGPQVQKLPAGPL